MTTSPRTGRAFAAAAIALAGVLALLGALALWLPSSAFAADKGKVSLEPVNFDGKTYTGTDPTGPFSTAFPKGLGKSDPNSATAELDDSFKPGTNYPWGSVGAKNGSFILNNTGKDMCKIVITITDTATFDTAPAVGKLWTAAVSKDKKTITFTPNDPKNCIKNGGWFWMQVPVSPQPGGTDKPTLQGSFTALAPDPGGETAVVELTTNDAFISTLYDVDLAIAQGSPSPSDTAVASASAPDSPSAAPSATVAQSPSDSAPPPTPTPVLTSASPGASQ